MKQTFNKDLIIQNLDDKTVIFDGEKSTLYTLNDTASLIFQKLKRGMPVEKIAAFLVKEYGIREETAKKDIETLIADLKKKNILKHGKA